MSEKVYIFGAHSRGRTLAAYLKALYPDTEVAAYLYNNEEKNPNVIENVPVFSLKKRLQLHTEYPMYIATRGIYHEEITKQLHVLGFQKIYPVTVELDLKLRNDYLKQYFLNKGEPFLKLVDLETGHLVKEAGNSAIYVAKSIYDRALQQKYVPAPYEREIQVGAALTDKRLYPEILTDDAGENISEKNKQYCELTALYWIWKHAKEDIVGLAHYRRHFILPDNWEQIMREHKIDAVLTVPTYAAPNIEENYKNRHDSFDWDFLMEYLKEREGELYQEARSFFKGNLYSACNMFIMKKEVLDSLCSWMFPILDQVVQNGGWREDTYQNRYPGFISERLMSFYFERSSSKYKIIYADKRFLP